MKPVVIVGDETDRGLVSHLLDADPVTRGRYKVQAAGGGGSSVSLGRTYLATREDLPVVVVLNADTTDPGRASSDRQLAADLLLAAGPADRFRLVVAIPTLDAALFADRAVADVLFGRRLTDADWVEARFAPRSALARLAGLGPRGAGLTRWLAGRDLSALADVPVVRELRAAVAAVSAVPHPV